MEKKYQVFVSSTYQDLIEERQRVIEALLGKNCFPVGMEYFPAANDDQFTVIKKLIDRCDYYILIIGGRYGSIEPKSRKSYTQLEFEYAISRGIPVASFYHAKPSELPAERVEPTDVGKQRLGEFKTKVQEKLCDSWKEPYELAFKVSKSLDYLFENSPRVGWVKADEISSAEANKELLKLKEENAKLNQQIDFLSLNVPVGTDLYCQGEDKFTIEYINDLEDLYPNEEHKIYSYETTWNEIFRNICLQLKTGLDTRVMKNQLNEYLLGEDCSMTKRSFDTICIQLSALKLIELRNGLYTLSTYGYNEMVRLLALRK